MNVSKRFSPIRALAIAFAAALITCFMIVPAAFAASVYTNPNTNYEVVIEDNADLLTDAEEQMLASDMIPLTEYGNIGFHSIDSNASSTSSYARSYYHAAFGTQSGTVFLVDMDNREIFIFSDGANYKVITKSKADVITDNVYRFASKGDYYGCASSAFEQMQTLLEGNRIAQPMKYVSNALLAIILGLLINFIVIASLSKLKRANYLKVLEAAQIGFNATPPVAEFINETKRYDPVSSDSGGSSGGGGGGHSSGGGGGGGGGFSSGGGGGHRF